MESGDRASRDRTTEGIVRRLIGGGIALAARFTTSLRVGSGAHTAFDGLSGPIVSDGTSASLVAYDVTGTVNWVRLNRNAAQFFISTAEGASLAFDATTGIPTQAALTTLAAGTNITLGIAGFSAQGSRLIVPTGAVYAVVHLTATGAIAAGSIVATLAAGHRPPSTIGATATKFTGGVLTAPVAAALLINSAGQIVTETALANTDTLVAIVTFMTV
jgi:hypothetical protein